MSGTSVGAIDVAVGAQAWSALGFAVDDGGVQIGATRLAISADGELGGLTGWELIAGDAAVAQSDDVDGIQTRWAPVAEAPGTPPAHPNSAVRLDHVVVQTPDIDRTFAALQQAGMTLRRERNAGSTRQPLRQGFFRHGEAIVEVVGPAEVAGDGPASLWGIVVVIKDMDTAVAEMGDALGSPRDAVQPGRRIATVRAEAVAGLPLAVMTE